jgi:hypothetical protein
MAVGRIHNFLAPFFSHAALVTSTKDPSCHKAMKSANNESLEHPCLTFRLLVSVRVDPSSGLNQVDESTPDEYFGDAPGVEQTSRYGERPEGEAEWL